MDTYGLEQCESQSSCCLGGHVLAVIPGWGWEVPTGTEGQWRFLQWKWERRHSLYSYREARCSGPNVFYAENVEDPCGGCPGLFLLPSYSLSSLPSPFSLARDNLPERLGFQLTPNCTVHLSLCVPQLLLLTGFPRKLQLLHIAKKKIHCLLANCISLVGCLKVKCPLAWSTTNCTR